MVARLHRLSETLTVNPGLCRRIDPGQKQYRSALQSGGAEKDLPDAVGRAQQNKPAPRLHHRPLPERHLLDHLIAPVFGISRRALQSSVRGGARVALVRQVGMYLAHIVLEVNLTQAARMYGRDRTTAAYACAVIEDLREDRIFDHAVSELERAVRVHIRHRHRDMGLAHV